MTCSASVVIQAGFIATKGGATWRTNLDAQYTKTDETLDATLSDLKAFPAAAYGAEFAASLNQALKLIEQLSDQRQRVQSLSVPVSVMAGYYTSTNRQLLDVLSAIAALADDPTVKGNAIAYVNLLEGKERAGLETCDGRSRLWRRTVSQQRHLKKFLMLLGAQDAFMSNANAYATNDIRAFYAETVNGPAVTTVDTFRNVAREGRHRPDPGRL